MSTLTLYEIPPSPNNMKARIGLRYKGLEFERVPVNPQDRSSLVKVSGQPLTPVLKHGETVIFDSGAILRYLDGNFRDTPRLFAEDTKTLHEIEEWESYAGTTLSEPVGMVFGQVFAPAKEEAVCDRATELMAEATARLEGRLAESDYLVGSVLTAADIFCAPWVSCAMVSEAAAVANPIVAFFRQHLRLGEGRDRTRAWVGRVMKYDA